MAEAFAGNYAGFAREFKRAGMARGRLLGATEQLLEPVEGLVEILAAGRE